MQFPDVDERILRRPEVRELTGLTNSVLDRLVRSEQFPRPFKLQPTPECRAVGWSYREVSAWIADRIASRDREAA